jgi:hypothetical protein
VFRAWSGCFLLGTARGWPRSVLLGCGWWRSEDVGESLLWGCSGAALVAHVPSPVVVFLNGSFCVGFPVLFCLSFS